MLDGKILIGEFQGPIDGARPGAVSFDKVTSLDHEILNLLGSANGANGIESQPLPTYDSMELAIFVALGPPLGGFALPRAELAKILRSSRGDVCEELHLDPS